MVGSRAVLPQDQAVSTTTQQIARASNDAVLQCETAVGGKHLACAVPLPVLTMR